MNFFKKTAHDGIGICACCVFIHDSQSDPLPVTLKPGFLVDFFARLVYNFLHMKTIATRHLLRLICVLLACLCLLTPLRSAMAQDEVPTSTCASYLLCDADTSDVLLANKPDERIYPASVTKMMTALILVEQKSDLNELVTVGKEINGFGAEASLMGLKVYEKISYLDLLYGMILVSGNDAAATVAVNVSGSISAFAELMNKKAADLGMTNSHFVNPHGMHSVNHYTTSADLAKLAIAFMHNSTLAVVAKTVRHTTKPTNKFPHGHALETTNRLISDKPENSGFRYAPAVGIKTGSTTPAQGCFVAAAQKDGRTLVAVLMGDSSVVNGIKYAKRWTDAVKLFDYGFSQKRFDLLVHLSEIQVKGMLAGAQTATLFEPKLPSSLGIYTDDATAVAMAKDGAITVTIEYNQGFSAFAPLSSSPGTAVYAYGGKELYRAELAIAPQAVAITALAGRAIDRPLKIVLWMGAFLASAGLLVFLLIAPRLKRFRRRRSSSNVIGASTQRQQPSSRQK
jgi:D-alanyl-D-alanine carboxypeptidase